MNEFIDAGSVDVQVPLQFLDATTSLPVTVTAATTNLLITVWRQGAGSLIFFDDATSPVISDLAAFDSPHTPGGILVIQDGLHRFDLTDAAVAAGPPRVYVTGRADGIVMIPLTIFLAPPLPIVGQEAPPAQPTYEYSQAYLYKLARNESRQNRATGRMEILDDTGATVDHAAATDDTGGPTGVFTRGKFGAGP